VGPGRMTGGMLNRAGISLAKAASEEIDRRPSAYSVEKLSFGGKAISQVYRIAAEYPRKTRRVAGGDRLRTEIVKSGCALESGKLQAF
jgi:hypothetical protein